MERNVELIFKTSPLLIAGKKLFLSAYDGEMFEYDLLNENLYSRQFDFVFACDLFSLFQETVNEQYHCSIYMNGQLKEVFIEGLIEDITLIYDKNSCELFLYTDKKTMAISLSSLKQAMMDVREISTGDAIQPGVFTWTMVQ